MTDKEMNIGIFNEISSEKTEEMLNKIAYVADLRAEMSTVMCFFNQRKHQS